MFDEIQRIEDQLRPAGRRLVASWNATRTYSAAELRGAKAFTFQLVREFEPEGEAQGTSYDETKACRLCGAGAIQTGTLALRNNSFPKNVEIARTIAGEIVVTKELEELLQSAGFSGVNTAEVRIPGLGVSENLRQLLAEPATATVSEMTHFADDPFSRIEGGRCERGDTLGLNRISELYLDRRGLADLDLQFSRQFEGHRLGVLRPTRIPVLSPRLASFLREKKVRGLRFEIAHLAEL